MWKIRGDLFVDVGANEGTYSVGLSKHFKHIIACEPNPKPCKILTERKRRNMDVLPIAISDKDGSATLFLDNTPNRCSGSADTILPIFIYGPPSKPDAFKTTYQGEKGIPVETRSLDSLLNQPIDLVKIDVEGAEFLVLHGATRLFRNRMIRRIMVELHDTEREPTN
jgi:FkbM family methyltransferase